MECNIMYFISYVLEFIKRGIEKKEIYNFIIIIVSFTLGRIVIPKVIKIPIRILKSYDFTIQYYENDSNLN